MLTLLALVVVNAQSVTGSSPVIKISLTRKLDFDTLGVTLLEREKSRSGFLSQYRQSSSVH